MDKEDLYHEIYGKMCSLVHILALETKQNLFDPNSISSINENETIKEWAEMTVGRIWTERR